MYISVLLATFTGTFIKLPCADVIVEKDTESAPPLYQYGAALVAEIAWHETAMG